MKYDDNYPSWEPGNKFAMKVQEIRDLKRREDKRRCEAGTKDETGVVTLRKSRNRRWDVIKFNSSDVICIKHPWYDGKSAPEQICRTCLHLWLNLTWKEKEDAQ